MNFHPQHLELQRRRFVVVRWLFLVTWFPTTCQGGECSRLWDAQDGDEKNRSNELTRCHDDSIWRMVQAECTSLSSNYLHVSSDDLCSDHCYVVVHSRYKVSTNFFSPYILLNIIKRLYLWSSFWEIPCLTVSNSLIVLYTSSFVIIYSPIQFRRNHL